MDNRVNTYVYLTKYGLIITSSKWNVATAYDCHSKINPRKYNVLLEYHAPMVF